MTTELPNTNPCLPADQPLALKSNEGLGPTRELVERLNDEADLCRNEGAEDIAALLDEAVAEIRGLEQSSRTYFLERNSARDLLLKAARAAGYGLNARGQSLRETEMPNEPALWLTHATWWNPLTDSGQALDLAVTLEMDIGQMLTEGCVTVTGVAFDGEALAHDVPWGTDPTAATRRAIVLVAADMAN